ncbi:DUF5054 domain-containing protein [Paenibacillus glycinis]|nr:DUF5054 domain-containing protein [Paenibacillus glycinis]
MKPEKIYVVFKTHVDLGFTDLPSGVVRQYKERMMEDVLNVCEATAANPPGHRYVWTLPAWMLQQCLDEPDAERRARLEQLVQAGQLIWHALPFTTHTEFCGVEEYMRGLYMSEELNRKYGREVIAAKMTDVPGHAWMLPSLLAQAGVRFLHLGVNACSAPVELPRLFWWEGPDGSRVLTWYSAGEYGTSLLPPDDWEYPIWFALLQTHDNFGPQSSVVVQELLDDVAAKYPDAEVHIGTMDDFARDFIARGYDDIPVIAKDLADSWIHGVGTYPPEVAQVRGLRYDLASAESLLATQPKPDDAEAMRHIAKGYEQTLLFGEHTWGIDVKSNLLPGRPDGRAFWTRDIAKDRAAFPDSYRKAEQSWEEQRDYVRTARRELAAAVPAPGADAADGMAVTVHNPLPRARQFAVVDLGEALAGGRLVDPATEKRYPVDAAGRAVIDEIAPLETRALLWQAGASGEAKLSACDTAFRERVGAAEALIENGSLRIRADGASGRIVSFYDKRAGKEWAAEGGFGEYQYEVFGKTDILRFVKRYAYDLRDWYVNDFGKPGYPRIGGRLFENGDARTELIREGGRQQIRILYGTDPESRGEFGNAATAELVVTLDGEASHADFEWKLAGKRETAFAEAGYFVLPLNVGGPQYRLQKLGAVVDPVRDIARGANTRLHCVDQWVDVTGEDGSGLAVFPLDTPLCSIGEPGIFQYDEAYVPEEPVLFFNLFNNQWGTNFPQWIGGDLAYRFRLQPHAGDWKAAGLEAAAEELRRPLIAARGEAAANRPLLREPLRDVRWLAVKTAESGEDAVVIRWMNATDERRETTLALNGDYAAVIRCSGVEREIAPLEVRDGRVTLAMRPYEIVTLKLCRS